MLTAQHPAAPCSTLQHPAAPCSTLQHPAAPCCPSIGSRCYTGRCFVYVGAGGLLVLEPQPWRSYCQAITKKQTSGVPFRDLEALQLRPETFIDVLTQVSAHAQKNWGLVKVYACHYLKALPCPVGVFGRCSLARSAHFHRP